MFWYLLFILILITLMILLNQILPKGLGNKHKQHEHFKILETSKLNQNYWPTRILNLGGSGRVYAQALVSLYSKKPSAGFYFILKLCDYQQREFILCVFENHPFSVTVSKMAANWLHWCTSVCWTALNKPWRNPRLHRAVAMPQTP